MGTKTAKPDVNATLKKLIGGALDDAQAELTRAAPGGFKRLRKREKHAVEEMLREVSKGVHPDVGKLIRGPRRFAALRPPAGSGIPLQEEVLSPPALSAIAKRLEPLLESNASKAYPGRDQLSLLGERFGMTPHDLAFLIENKSMFDPAEVARRKGQVSDVSGRTFESLLENNPMTRERERRAIELELRKMLGNDDFVYNPGSMARLALPRRRVGPKRVKAMFETLTEQGFDRAAPGIWVKRLGAVADEEGELTDGISVIVDMRNKATAELMITGLRPSNIDLFVKTLALPKGRKRPKVVGVRESKLESVVGDLTEQVPQGFRRLLENAIAIEGRSLSGAKMTLSEHLVVSLLTEKRKVTPKAMKEIRDAFEQRTGVKMKEAVEIDSADRDAQLARELADTVLDVGDDKLVKKAADKVAAKKVKRE